MSNGIVTNGGRRWAARELRLRADATERVGNLASIVTKITGVTSKDWRGQLETLAEMIDRPTCKDMATSWAFTCSRCKWSMFPPADSSRFHYCPNCGAEITE